MVPGQTSQTETAFLWITVDNRVYHHLSESEVGGGKRISQHRCGHGGKTGLSEKGTQGTQYATRMPKEISMTAAKRKKTADAEKFLLEAERYEESGDLKSAFKSLLAGARLEDSGCQANLGNFYSSGKGTRKSLEKAAYWYKRAYRNGAGYAASNLAIDRRNAGNIRSAVIWFKKAIARKDGDACIPLAKIYIARRGDQKVAVAVTLLRQALRMSRDYLSQSGREEAESLLQELASRNVPSPD